MAGMRDKKMLGEAVIPSIVAIKTVFEFEKSSRTGTGVFVGRKLIVTSAHVVGIILSTTVHIGRSFALTSANKILKTKVVAVNFGGDVAVLEAEAEAEEDLPPPCVIGCGNRYDPWMVITKHEDCNGRGFFTRTVYGCEDTSGRSEWPYELEDEFGWARYGVHPFDLTKIVPGSPWFNYELKVVGIVSCHVGAEPTSNVGGFVVPPLRIRSVLDYAKTKGAHDPIVLDSWINAPPTSDVEPLHIDDGEECCFFQNNCPVGWVDSSFLFPDDLRVR